MRRRSRKVEIGFVAVVASAALAGCDSQRAFHRDWQQCVDRNNLVVEDRLCNQPVAPSGGHVPGYFPGYYYWLYSSRPFYRGDTVIGGYNAPRPNMEVARSSTSARGGFGSSAHAGGSVSS